MQHAILTLIRHAETTGNLNRLLQGVTDSPVTVFGQAQIEALAQTWATTIPTSAPQQATKGNQSVSKLDLPPPTLIVCSPIGRARKTAEAIHRASTRTPYSDAGAVVEDAFKDGSTTRCSLAADQLSRPGLALVVDSGLAEKDFGWKESTRGGVHVAGYPKGSGSGESRADFLRRVHNVGAEWLSIAAHLASSATDPLKDGAIPHIVLVSHGMWISTFLSAHPPTSITQESGQPGFLPFAANTGMFSLRVTSSPKIYELNGKPDTVLFRSNDIRHLANVKRQKGGIGRGAFDNKQTKLSSFFARPASDNQHVEANHTAQEASPTKKRKI